MPADTLAQFNIDTDAQITNETGFRAISPAEHGALLKRAAAFYANVQGAIMPGGNTAGNTLKIGTIDNYALYFKTNSIDRCAVHTNGNVTIGTLTDDGNKLRVDGTAHINGFKFDNPNAMFQTKSFSGSLTNDIGWVDSFGGSAGYVRMRMVSNSGTPNMQLNIYKAGAVDKTITFGPGSISLETLTVTGSLSLSGAVGVKSVQHSGAGADPLYSYYYRPGVAALGISGFAASDSRYQIRLGGIDFSSGTEFFTILPSTGYTGIKTATPTEQLHVTGNCKITGSIKIGSVPILILTGTGTPEASVIAPVGSTFHREDGGAGTSYYVKESGAGNTGWVAK